MLICPDAQPTDQGAYSCEAINGRGSVFATPDAIVVVTGKPSAVCQPPQFNSAAINRDQCLNCFCFGATDQCYSSDMYITQVGMSSDPLLVRCGRMEQAWQSCCVRQYHRLQELPRMCRPTSRVLLTFLFSYVMFMSTLFLYFFMGSEYQGWFSLLVIFWPIAACPQCKKDNNGGYVYSENEYKLFVVCDEIAVS